MAVRRVEHDSDGEVAVPAAACGSARTARAIDNIPIGTAAPPRRQRRRR